MNALGIALAALLFVAAGCSATASPACSPQAEAKLEAAYVAEALQVCAGKTYLTCPELPALREKYAAQREEWVQCRH